MYNTLIDLEQEIGQQLHQARVEGALLLFFLNGKSQKEPLPSPMLSRTHTHTHTEIEPGCQSQHNASQKAFALASRLGRNEAKPENPETKPQGEKKKKKKKKRPDPVDI